MKRWDELEAWLREGILAERIWLKGELREPVTVPSQVDIAALQIHESEIVRIVAVYSCKSSAAERFQQDLFWAERLRGRGIRFCFVTMDEQFLRYALEGKGRQAKGIRLAQALYDRVYLFTDQPSHYGGAVFQPITQVAEDLAKWMETP